jgi:hypothetical protein
MKIKSIVLITLFAFAAPVFAASEFLIAGKTYDIIFASQNDSILRRVKIIEAGPDLWRKVSFPIKVSYLGKDGKRIDKTEDQFTWINFSQVREAEEVAKTK